MKLQDVLLKAMAKKIRWWDAAEIIGVSDRTMRRWRERLETEGSSGKIDRRKGQPSDKRVPLALVEEVLRLSCKRSSRLGGAANFSRRTYEGRARNTLSSPLSFP